MEKEQTTLRKSNIETKSSLIKGGLFVMFFFLLALVVSTFRCQILLIQGESMLPAYHNLQSVLVDKHTKDYHKNDVIAFHCKALDSVLVKRIVGEPGDYVIILDGRLYVNDEAYPFYEDVFFTYPGLLEEKITLENDEYLVIGDNVVESKDSRYEEIGVISVNDIIGKIK